MKITQRKLVLLHPDRKRQFKFCGHLTQTSRIESNHKSASLNYKPKFNVTRNKLKCNVLVFRNVIIET